MLSLSRIMWALLLFALGGVVSVVILRWLMREKTQPTYAPGVLPPRPAEANIPLPFRPSAEVEELPVPVSRIAEAVPDDLTRIDGIGPAYARGLAALGILTFAQLAAQDADDLTERLKASGVRVVGDSVRSKDWIGQARRLAAG